MWKKWLQLFCGFLCCYLFIKWFPISFSFHVSEIIVDFLFHPFEFLASSCLFIIGFILYADLMREGTTVITRCLFHKRDQKTLILELLPSFFVVSSFFALFILGFWQTVIFFCFSVIYGMISLDFQKLKTLRE